MKKLLLPMMLLVTTVVTAQINWYPKTTGLDLTYFPSGMTTQNNGTIYLSSTKFTNLFVNKFYTSTDAGQNWTEITPTGLADVGNIHAIEKSPNHLVLLGKTTQGDWTVIKKSTDGNTWTDAFNGFELSYSANDFAAIDENNWFVTGSRMVSNVWEHAIFKSTDQGANWTELTTTGLDDAGLSYAMDVVNGDMLLTALNKDGVTGNEIYKSTDGGASWALSQFGFNETYAATDMAVRSNGMIYMTATKSNGSVFESRLYYSVDEGDTWDLQGTSGLSDLGYSNGVNIASNEIYIFGQNETTANGGVVFQSDLDPISSINDLQETSARAYPNPLSDILTINLKEHPVHGTITNVSGQRIKMLNLVPGTNQINTIDFAPGVYFVTIQYDSYSEVIKLLKK